MPLLSVRNVRLSTRNTSLVGPLSFDIDHGERIALIGPSGSGKSLTASVILGTVPPTIDVTGEVFLSPPTTSGHAASPLNVAKMRFPQRPITPRLAFVSQDPTRALNPTSSVGEHIATALASANGTSRRVPSRSAAVLGLLEALAFEQPERVAAALPHMLSGGQRQRVCLGIALATQPDLLIADEPTTALDAISQDQVLDLLNTQLPPTSALLFISHDMDAVDAVNATPLRMDRGLIRDEPHDSHEPTPHEVVQAIAEKSPAESERDRTIPSASQDHASRPAAFSLSQAEVTYQRTRRSSRRRFAALTSTTLTIRAGEHIGIVGASGSGKSTLIHTLLGLTTPTTGSVHVYGEPIDALDTESLRSFRRRVQFVPQDTRGSLNPRVSALSQCLEPLRFLSPAHHEPDGSRTHEDRAKKTLTTVGLHTDLWPRKPHEVSGGQAQRIALARALVNEPDFLVADEPLSGLDPALRTRVERILEQALAARPDMGLILVSHDLASVARLCTRILVLDSGTVIDDLSLSDLRTAQGDGNRIRHRLTQLLEERVLEPTVEESDAYA